MTHEGNRWRLGAALVVAIGLWLTAPRAARAGEASALRLAVSAGPVLLQTSRVVVFPNTSTYEPLGRVGYALGPALDWRLRWLSVGVNVDVALTLFHQMEAFAGAHLGLTRRPATGYEISVQPEAGLHTLVLIGEGFLTKSDAPSVTLPYVGGRVGFLSVRGPEQFDVGLSLVARWDLGRQTVIAHTESDINFDWDYTIEVGGFMTGLFLRAQR